MFSLALEQIHAIGENVGIPVKVPPPDAIHVIVLIQEHLAVHGMKLFRGIHIKMKMPPGFSALNTRRMALWHCRGSVI